MGGDLSKSLAASSEMQKYFHNLQKEIDNCYKIAKNARKKGYDPEKIVEIPQALDLAKRVEELVGPKDIAEKIRKKTKEIKNRELVSLEISKEIAKNMEKYNFKSKEEALDQAVRTGLAILTEGVLVAPLEGIADVKLGKNNDGSDYVDLYFSGPIRSAGGTGQAMSVLIADIVRREMKISSYKPTKGEIERYKEEIPLYKRAQHLQYTPSVDEIEKIVSNCPICINGEGTEKEEVTGYRDLPRIETNRLRGGACLVIAEGLCLKSPKILKHVKKLKLKGWEFLDIFAQKKEDEDSESDKKKIPEIKPSKKYIGEVIAGRPVFSHPSRKGGFRLRYGRARTAGLASTAINPASMYLLDEFIAVGTQIKTERPGKGTIGTPCTEIEGPMVLLTNGDFIQYTNSKNIEKTKVKTIIDLGEILIPYGEFLENNSLLPKSSYVTEWWVQELSEKLKTLPKKNTIDNLRKSYQETKNKLKEEFSKDIDLEKPLFLDAVEISKKYDIPLHPYHNLFWHDMTVDEIKKLRIFILENGKIENDKLKLKLNPEIKDIFVKLGALHIQRQEQLIFDRYSNVLIFCLGLENKEGKIIKRTSLKETKNAIKLVSHLSEIKIKERSPFRIGTRMGRPEKAAERKMRPPPHVLFPVGNYGGNQRLLGNAAEKSKIEIEAGTRICSKCSKKTFKLVCSCGSHTEIKEGRIEVHDIHLFKELENAKKNISERTLPGTIKGVIGTISKHKTPEPLEKGILRAKHNVFVFKDGTIRFDMTDAPLTHFKANEIGISVDRLKELGYTHDFLGDEIVSSDQIIELKVQDIIISKLCAEYFTKVANFVDDLLVKYYGQKKFYNIKKLEQLTGHLTVGLAPHTSAGSLSRIIGFTNAQVSFAHPYYHAAKRRNCLKSDTTVVVSNSGNLDIIKLKDLYEKTDSKEKIVDDFGTKQKLIRGISTYSINNTNGGFENNKIKSIIKSKSPNFVQKLTLKSGRSFVASPYHRVNVFSDGKAITKKVVELNKDDKFFTSKNIDIKEEDIVEFDLLELFLHKNNSHIVIRGIKEFVDSCILKIGGLKKTSEILNINKKTFSNYIYRDSIPINILSKLIKTSGYDFSDIPKESNLGVKRNDSLVPRIIKVNSDLLRLVGYYLSEGHSRFIKKGCYQVGFACTEKEIIDDILKCINNSFKVNTYQSKSGIFICNRIIHDFFIDILKAGKNAKSKRIPKQFINIKKEKIKELLKSYFSGDGSVEKNRLHISCSSVSLNLLKDIGFQLLRFGIFYRLKSEIRKPTGVVKSFYDKKQIKRVFTLNYISIRSSYARLFYEKIGFTLTRKNNSIREVLKKERKPRIELFGDFVLDPVKDISNVKSNDEYFYDLEVENSHNFLINDFLITKNCDGDEDGQMLLMDALLNFSHSYIPDKRGGKMDLPLILTTRLDPSEVDKEAHNLDTLFRYPLEFYRATETHEHSKDLEKQMDLVSGRLGTELQYEHFGFTHDTNDISEGPKMSNYKTLKSMMDKMNAQLNLAAKIRAVDESDVAYKVIERHFLPDILGNLRAFSKQSVRCPSCNITYRRPPLKGVCHKCGGKLTLTVHEKSVKKYLEISKDVAKRYNISPYACQRIVLVEKSINSLFESDKIKTTKLDDFF